jgi:hypothetical protein
MKKRKTVVVKQIIWLMVFSLSLIGCISTQVNYVNEAVPFNEASFFAFFDSNIFDFRVDGNSFGKRSIYDFDPGSLPISPWITSWWYIPSGTHVITVDYLNPYSGIKGTMSGTYNFQPGQYYEIYSTGNFDPSLHISNISGYPEGGKGKAVARGEKRIAARARAIGNTEGVTLPETWWARSTGDLDWDIIHFLDENSYERYISLKSSEKETGFYQRNGDEIILGIVKFQIRGGVLIQNMRTNRIYFKRNNLTDFLLLQQAQ